MTGRPGDRPTEMNGGSTAFYLARTPGVPLLSMLISSHRSRSKGAFRLPGATWDRFRCAVETSPGHDLYSVWFFLVFAVSHALGSEELKKAVAVLEEKIQQHSRRRGQFSSSRFPCRKAPKQGLAEIAFHAAGKSVRNHFPAASKFAGKPFQQGISDSHSLL